MLGSLSAVALLGVPLIAVSLARPQATTPTPIVSSQITLGFGGTLEVEGRVAVLSGSLGPERFFENLQAFDTAVGRTFVRDQKEVRFFPDRLAVRIRIWGP